MKELLKFLKCISEETRFKILKVLMKQQLCVCELTEILDRSQPCISQHLKKFKELELDAVQGDDLCYPGNKK